MITLVVASVDILFSSAHRAQAQHDMVQTQSPYVSASAAATTGAPAAPSSLSAPRVD